MVNVLQQALQDDQIGLAFVFGSIARGDAHAESDVDLMVIGVVGLRRLTQLLSGIADRLGREINPHVLTPEEFRERIQRSDHFVTSILNTKKLFVKGTEHELAAMGR
jgi:predicted nucleotidyltransferase